MGVRFIIGRAGTGKTAYCLQGIEAELRAAPLGPPVYWLLPRQATFMAERELTCRVHSPGFCRARVLSLDELSSEILRECGGATVPLVGSLGRQMIVGHLLRLLSGRLRFFQGVAHRAGTAAKIEAVLAEFDNCGQDPARLGELVAAFSRQSPLAPEVDGDLFQAKLHDLSLIYSAYREYLGSERLDPARRMQQVLAGVSQSRTMAGATFYVDAFTEFDETEIRLLAHLAKVARSVHITLQLDPDSPVLRSIKTPPAELSLFNRIERVYVRLVQAIKDESAAIETPILLRSVRRFDNPSLAMLEQRLFAADQAPVESHVDDILLVEAPDRRVEVEHAARHIRNLVAGGMRYRDIAVLVRDLEDYHHLFAAVFVEHRIPFFVDRRRGMAHHPLLQMLRAVLELSDRQWSHDAIMLLVKSGLGGLGDAQADELENYVLEHGLRGDVWRSQNPWQWGRQPEEGQEDTAARIDSLRRDLVARLEPFLSMCESQSPLTVRQIAAALYDLFIRFDVPATLARWISQDRAASLHEQAAEHEQVWSQLMELLDQMVDLLGEEPVTLDGFRDIIESGLAGFDLALTPPTVDQLLVGQADRTRTPAVRAVLVLGVNEGVFPRCVREPSVLSDAERKELADRQFQIDPGSERALLDEDLLAYGAFTRASTHLYVSRACASESGRELAASPYWRRLRAMFPLLPVTVVPQDIRGDPGLVSTPRELLTGLMHWARSSDRAERPGVWLSLYQFLATHPCDGSPLDLMRYRAWPALAYTNQASLGADLARGLFPRPLRADARQIETFAACPYKHFLRYGLGLRPRSEDEVLPLEFEQIIHRGLDDLVRRMLARQVAWTALRVSDVHRLVESLAAEVRSSLRGQIVLSDARNRYLLRRVHQAIEEVIAAQRAAAARSLFRVGFGAVRFGDTGQLPPLIIRTPAGNELHLHGRIDRLDLLPDRDAFAAIDYRLAAGDLNLTRACHGLSIRLLVTMLALESCGQDLAGRRLSPAGAFCVQLLSQLRSVAHPADAPDPDDPLFLLRGRYRGVFNGEYLDAFDAQAQEGDAVLVSAFRKKDGGFGNKDRTDVAEPEEFAALLKHTRRQVGLLADQILSGLVEIKPYRIGTATPCAHCEFRGVCRFDTALNRYHHIQAKPRSRVLDELAQEASDER